ncbi:MAG: Na/Pi cotransporter family protein, partial [Rhodobacteraceae bacterium]|nr:Na/Pi cotransporter family protein [Paracoccaceae bacterium]
FEAFKDSFDLAALAVPGYPGLFLFAAIGAAATVVMQSSHATLVLILTALAAGQITYENALALAIGANIGTTITAIIGSLSANVEGKRLAGAHLIFNVVTGIIAIIFIYQFMTAVDAVAGWTGIAEDNYTMKLAVFHTLFNITGVIVMVPLIHRLAGFLTNYLPAETAETTKPLYLHEAAFEFPETALLAVKNETIHLYHKAFEVMSQGINLRESQILESEDLEAVIEADREVLDIDLGEHYETRIKVLYNEIVHFISRSHSSIPSMYSEDLYRLRGAAAGIVESVKHVKELRRNITTYMVSDNDTIRKEYNKLRLKMATVMREVYKLEDKSGNIERDVDVAASLKQLEDLTAVTDLTRRQLHNRVNDYIAKETITSHMATSLSNDFGYSDQTVRALYSYANSLFITGEDEVEDTDENEEVAEEMAHEVA